MNVINFLLNRDGGQKGAQVVEAPAFSLTKVMAVVAPVVTAVVAFVTSALKDKAFTTGQITTMIVSLVAFLAVTASADVLARGIATSADKAAAGRLRLVKLEKPLPGRIKVDPNGHRDIEVVAVSDANPPEFLCRDVDSTSLDWVDASKVEMRS